MKFVSAIIPARPWRAAFLLAGLFAAAAVAYAAVGGIAAPTQPASATTETNKLAAKPASQPSWTQLTPQQQHALSPLAAEWDKIDLLRKKKWLEIGNKFAGMKPDEQQRIQDRMRDWAKLTPEQRRMARENYTRAKRIQPEQKSEKWQQYQQLPEEQKRELAASASTKKQVANLPTPTQSKVKPIPPIRSSLKPVQTPPVAPPAAIPAAPAALPPPAAPIPSAN